MAASIPIPWAPYHISLVLFTLQIWRQPASLFPELTISASSCLLCRHDGSQHPYSLSSLPYQPHPVYSADMMAASIPIPWAPYHVSLVLFTLQTWRQPASLFPELLTMSASSCLLCRHDGSQNPYSLSSLPCQPRPVYSADMMAASIPIPWAPHPIVLFTLQTWWQPASLFPELLTISALSCLLCRHDSSQHPYSLSLPYQPRPVYSADMTAASIPIPWAPYHISLVLFTLQTWRQPASLFPEPLTISASSCLLCRHDGSQHPYSLSSLPCQPRPVYSADMTAASIPIPWAPYHISLVLFTLQTWWQPASLFPELLTISALSCLLCRHDSSQHPYSLSLPYQPRPVYSADMTAASIPIPWAPYHVSLVLFTLQTWRQPVSLFPELLTISALSCLLCRHDGSQHPYSLRFLPYQPRPVYSADVTAARIPIPWAPYHISLVLFTLQTWWQPASLFPELLTMSASSCLLCRYDGSQHPHSLSSSPYRPVYSADMTAATIPIPWAPYHISLVLFTLQTWRQPESLFPELLTMSASSCLLCRRQQESLFPELLTISASSCLLCRHDGSQHSTSFTLMFSTDKLLIFATTSTALWMSAR